MVFPIPGGKAIVHRFLETLIGILGNIEVRLTDLDAKNQHLFINDPKDAYSSPVTIVEQLEVVKTFCL